ncbi:hypothetical protein COM13_11590 [Bacillus pseudomycoides]|uniref:hypothetical protein n=1 Tax=Bacillus TaxID=1386 RepID=UPI0001A1957F|nr:MULTISPECIES: hypothetical protein [Bacillus]AIK40085.1 hypothetical protein DJ92_5270 [Bacillus pseudomycoides]AJI18682.1 hypothetical protein BG07_5038 [Bacillus pseudomycoides]EEM13883.1 hypothetical protein bpmyx0001_52710 [Bacillus pseudomycoides DSM 12442]MBJ8031465.1 hypothetical protein [Bacillus cereus group sp. N21]MEB3053004.1 hypothetical protein [Bacillus pseudomycoides]
MLKKLVVGVLATGILLTRAGGALAAEEFPYQVKTKGFNGQPVSIGFDNKTDLEDYLKKHPVPHCHKAKFL